MILAALPFFLIIVLFTTVFVEASLNGTQEYLAPMTLTEPELRQNPGSHFDTGWRMLTTEVFNNIEHDAPFVVFLEIRDANAVTIYLAFQTGTINAGDKIEVATSWLMPQEPAVYELRAFVISNFTNPEVLSEIKSSAVTAQF